MSDDFDLTQAYAVETPEDNRRLYRDWATSYDEGFIGTHGYVYHESVVRVLGQRFGADAAGPVVDIGCGTGVVGESLRAAGYEVVDGVDLSPEMLGVAATKQAADGSPIYRELLAADLTVGTPIDDDSYAAVVSAGTFTHGHLGPEPLGELVRIARPGATLAIGVNAEHFVSAGFGAWFDAAVAAGQIADFEIVEAPMYDPERYVADDGAENATKLSAVTLFRAT